MKLIIDIQDFVYNHIKEFNSTQLYELNVISAIKSGTPLAEELKKLRLQIHNMEEPDHDFEGFYQCQDEAIEIISKAIDELKGE